MVIKIEKQTTKFSSGANWQAGGNGDDIC